MTVFKDYKFTWWQVGLLKLCMISIGIIIGLYFANFFTGLVPLLWLTFFAPAIYLGYISVIKQK